MTTTITHSPKYSFVKQEVRNLEGQLHCETGPARTYLNGTLAYYLNGNSYSVGAWINTVAQDDKKLKTILTLKYA